MKKITWLFEGLDKVLSTISAITLFIMMMWIFIDVADKMQDIANRYRKYSDK